MAITKRGDEISRVSVTGRRVEDNDKCTLVVIREAGGTWALYPHGFGKFGVRLPKDEAVQVAKAILSSVHQDGTREPVKPKASS